VVPIVVLGPKLVPIYELANDQFVVLICLCKLVGTSCCFGSKIGTKFMNLKMPNLLFWYVFVNLLVPIVGLGPKLVPIYELENVQFVVLVCLCKLVGTNCCFGSKIGWMLLHIQLVHLIHLVPTN
jgi:hypothetical protein